MKYQKELNLSVELCRHSLATNLLITYQKVGLVDGVRPKTQLI